MSDWTITQGDCLDVLRTLPDASVDAIVTDPPYGLSFMGKRWDYDVPSVDVWRECLRVLKPGGHLLAFAGTRTQHRMAVRIEDAGFEIRDMIAWVYGSGFPKSLDVSKAIDKAAGAEREVVGEKITGNARTGGAWSEGTAGGQRMVDITAPATDAARQWSGWGTALKPALEPITIARKPLDGTVSENVLAHGTGALNVDGCRVGTETGRWPANLIHDGSEEVVGLFPETGQCPGTYHTTERENKNTYGGGWSGTLRKGHADSGSAARFFYCAKASKNDRDHGCNGLNLHGPGRTCYDPEYHEGGGKLPPRSGNHHPTVKPTDLMRYLVTLIAPPGGLVLDPFAGSGSTGRGARISGMRFHGIERDPDYCDIARARIAAAHLWTPDSITTENDPRQMDLLS